MKVFSNEEIIAFVKWCVPLAASFLALKGMQFIDTLMMGWIGPDALAAGALATNIFITLLVFCRGVISMLGVTIVHARGAHQKHEITSLVHQSIYLALALSIPVMLMAWQAPKYLVMIGQNPRVTADAQRLLQGLTWGIPGYLLFFVMREFISAFALSRAVMVVCFISIPLTFFGNYVLIYGKYGFPALGIAGIGYSSATVCWFMFLALLFYCRRHTHLKNYVPWQLSKPDLEQIKSIWIGGSSSGIIMVLDMITFLSATLFMGYFGVNELAAYQIAMQCVTTAFNLPLAVSVITALQVGHACSENNPLQARRTAYLGLSTGLVISAILSIIFICVPHSIVRLFLPNSEHSSTVFPTAQLFLIIASMILCFDGAQTIIIGALRGLKDTFAPMIISVICYVPIGISSAYLLAFHTSMGAVGIWYGLFLGILSLCLISGIRLKKSLELRH